MSKVRVLWFVLFIFPLTSFGTDQRERDLEREVAGLSARFIEQAGPRHALCAAYLRSGKFEKAYHVIKPLVTALSEMPSTLREQTYGFLSEILRTSPGFVSRDIDIPERKGFKLNKIHTIRDKNNRQLLLLEFHSNRENRGIRLYWYDEDLNPLPNLLPIGVREKVDAIDIKPGFPCVSFLLSSGKVKLRCANDEFILVNESISPMLNGFRIVWSSDFSTAIVSGEWFVKKNKETGKFESQRIVFPEGVRNFFVVPTSNGYYYPPVFMRDLNGIFAGSWEDDGPRWIPIKMVSQKANRPERLTSRVQAVGGIDRFWVLSERGDSYLLSLEGDSFSVKKISYSKGFKFWRIIISNSEVESAPIFGIIFKKGKRKSVAYFDRDGNRLKHATPPKDTNVEDVKILDDGRFVLEVFEANKNTVEKWRVLDQSLRVLVPLRKVSSRANLDQLIEEIDYYHGVLISPMFGSHSLVKWQEHGPDRGKVEIFRAPYGTREVRESSVVVWPDRSIFIVENELPILVPAVKGMGVRILGRSRRPQPYFISDDGSFFLEYRQTSDGRIFFHKITRDFLDGPNAESWEGF